MKSLKSILSEVSGTPENLILLTDTLTGALDLTINKLKKLEYLLVVNYQIKLELVITVTFETTVKDLIEIMFKYFCDSKKHIPVSENFLRDEFAKFICLDIPSTIEKLSGIELITIKRKGQLEKYDFTIENDKVYTNEELVQAAKFCLTLKDEDYPETWNSWFYNKVKVKEKNMTEIEFKIEMKSIAGALLAAEIDRLQNI